MQALSASPGTAAGDDPGSRRGSCGPHRAERAAWTCAIAVLVGVTIASGGTSPYLALDIAAGAVGVGLVPLLARWPVPATVALSVLAAVSPAATPPATSAALVVAEWQPLGIALSLAGTGIAAHLVRGTWRPIEGLPYPWFAVLVVVAYAAIVGCGTMIRAHKALVSSLRERAERAEAGQARRVAEARAAERATIAREMHDVLAHRLSLLATYAGALAYRPDAPPGQLSRAAEVIRSGAHSALEELREVIGVLRGDSGTLSDLTEGRSPLPGLADLPGLIEESRAAGAHVSADGAAWPPGRAPNGLPDTAGRTVYRVVQEGLTNARKHAPGEPVQVTLGGGPGAGLDVSVVSRLGSPPVPAAVPGAGTGLIGLAERLELAGGTLDWRNSGSGFRLHAWLPWPAAADADITVPNVTVPGAGVTE
ncbi:MAG: sensor histidine kinase [Trebonia sp.]